MNASNTVKKTQSGLDRAIRRTQVRMTKNKQRVTRQMELRKRMQRNANSGMEMAAGMFGDFFDKMSGNDYSECRTVARNG